MTIPIFPIITTESFLPGVGFPIKRAPEWSTEKHMSVSGRRTAFGRFSYPIYHYELTFSQGDGAFLRFSDTNPEFQELLAFYNTVGGARDLWIYQDPNRNTVAVAAPASFGTGDGTTTAFQLLAPVAGTIYSWSDPVFVAGNSATGDLVVYIDGIAQTDGVDYSTNALSGLELIDGTITFASAPAVDAALTWTGTYWWFCRFDDDTAEFSQFMYNLVELGKLNFSTEKIVTGEEIT